MKGFWCSRAKERKEDLKKFKATLLLAGKARLAGIARESYDEEKEKDDEE